MAWPGFPILHPAHSPVTDRVTRADQLSMANLWIVSSTTTDHERTVGVEPMNTRFAGVQQIPSTLVLCASPSSTSASRPRGPGASHEDRASCARPYHSCTCRNIHRTWWPSREASLPLFTSSFSVPTTGFEPASSIMHSLVRSQGQYVGMSPSSKLLCCPNAMTIGTADIAQSDFFSNPA
jgi:hypothetical protein